MSQMRALPEGKWIEWIRASDIKQEVQRQYAEIDKIKDEWGLRDKILRTVELRHVSGRWVMADRDVQAVVRDLKKPGVCAGIILSAQDRLFRLDRGSSMVILDEFRDYGKLILTPDGVIDLNNDSDWQTAMMRGLISGIDWRKIRSLCNSGKEAHRRQGIHPCGWQTLARGVLCEKVRNASNRVIACNWSYDGVDSERLRKAYELLVNEDLSMAEICRRIGGGFGYWTLIKSLRNPIWKGFQRYTHECDGPDFMPKFYPKPYVWRGKLVVPDPEKKRKMRRKTVPRKDGGFLQRIDALADNPVASEAMWDRAQEILKTRELKVNSGRRKGRGKSDREFLCLDCILECSCGAPMYGKNGSHGHGGDRYECATHWRKAPRCGQRSIPRIDLDETVRDLVTGRELVQEIIRAVLSRAEAIAEMRRPEPPSDNGEKQKLEQRKVEIFDSYRRKKITLAQMGTRMSEIEERIQAIESTASPAEVPVNYDQKRLVIALAAAFANFRRYPVAKQRAVLQDIVARITIKDRTMIGVTLKGAFLGGTATLALPSPGAKAALPSRWPTTFGPHDDLIVNFSKPIEIARYVQ